MKKVWILKARTPVEKMVEELFGLLNMIDHTDEEQQKKYDISKSIVQLENDIEDNPNGVFTAVIGKENYRQFCNAAKDYIDKHSPVMTRSDIQVIVAEIADEQTVWLPFNEIERKPGVEKYLFATLYSRET